MGVSRRRFLKITGASATLAAAGAPGLRGLRAAQPPVERGLRTVPTFCDLCFWKCGAIATVRDGVLWKIEGNPDDPLSRGRLCPRGTGGVGAHFDADRLRSPLLRASVRGEERWAEVTWDEALSHVAERLQRIKGEHGPEAVALFSHGIGGNFLKHTLKAYGTPNVAAPSFAQCRGPRDVGFELTFGEARRLAGAHRHPQRPLPRADRLAPRREHAQHAGAGVRRGGRQRRDGDRRRPALLGRGEQGEALPADQAGHRPRAAARVDERARGRGAVRPGVRRGARLRLRGVRRRDRGVHAGVGVPGDRHRAGRDPRDGARDGAPPPGDARAPRPARDLVRRRRAAQPRGRAAQRAARQLGPQGRLLPAGQPERARATRTRPTPRRRAARSTTPASATRSRARRSPPASARRRSPASRTRSRAGSSTRRTCCRRCPTRRRP